MNLAKEVNIYHKRLMNKIGKHKIPESFLKKWLKEFIAIDNKYKKLKSNKTGVAHKTILEKRINLSKKYIIKLDKYEKK